MTPSTLSQFVWSTTNKVGCAWKDCQSSLGFNLYVCNYMPPGNWAGRNVYERGSPCSQCPKGTCCPHKCPNKLQATYEGLCAAEKP
ncbi:venom allergen 5-like isoform X2 [Haemaphysalis longicornis]